MAQGYTATFMVLLLALAVLGDLTAVARRGVTKSSFAAVHMSNDAKIEEPREEDRITGAAGGKGYFRRRKMKQVKVAFTTGVAEIYSRSSSLGSPSTDDPSDTTLKHRHSDPLDRGQDSVTEGSEAQSLHGSQDGHTLQTAPPQKFAAEATEIFKMMNKDYHSKARRRPPINNKLPPADHL